MFNSLKIKSRRFNSVNVIWKKKMYSYQSGISEVTKSDNNSVAGFLVETALNLLWNNQIYT